MATVWSIWETTAWCEKMKPSFARRILDVVYAGTDHYGTISDDEEEAVNSTGGHWAYGEISHEGLQALLEYMDICKSSVFYDFGSGLGKVVAQCFLTTNTQKVVGIEMAGTRHIQAWQACERMGKLVDLVADIRASVPSLVVASWFEEQPPRDEALSPSFVLHTSEGDGRELRLIHGDCLKVHPSGAFQSCPFSAVEYGMASFARRLQVAHDDATHIYMANLTWPEATVERVAARAAALPSVRRIASLRPLPPALLAPPARPGGRAPLRLDGVVHVPMSWQDRNRESLGVPVYVYSAGPR